MSYTMEEKDVTNIASAVSNALAKLNADKEKNLEKDKPVVEEVFSCPDCGAKITGGIGFCQACGCALEWED